MDHVSFRNLRFDQHGTEVRQGQNVWRLLGGNHRLSLQGRDLRHFTGHRREDTRIVEVGFRGVEGRLVAFDLRFDGADLRLFHRHIGGGGIQILARNQLTLRQLLLAR